MSSLYASRIGTDTKRDLLLAYPETDEQPSFSPFAFFVQQ
jgi:hypothetical protein